MYILIIILDFRRGVDIADVNFYIQMLPQNIKKLYLPKMMYCYARRTFCMKKNQTLRLMAKIAARPAVLIYYWSYD